MLLEDGVRPFLDVPVLVHLRDIGRDPGGSEARPLRGGASPLLGDTGPRCRAEGHDEARVTDRSPAARRYL
jgi:hypothetical protein